ncbi:MAG: hypothetical protein V2I34_12775 [Bacteroidales bacterium]|nr:hypothetical protein [Bacteroidales bacterium]
MNRKLILFICLVFNLGFIAKAQPYCDFIKKVREYQNSIKVNEHSGDEYQMPEVDTTSFDINVYMSLFDKLKLKAGKKVFLVNRYSKDSGKPVLCVQDSTFNMDKFVDEITTKRFRHIDSLVEQLKSEFLNKNYPEEKINVLERFREFQKKSFTRNSALIQYAIDSSRRVCNNLIPEDTPTGYLQYLFFNQMGEQFALFWHAHSLEKTVLCDKEDVKYFLSHYNERKVYFEYEENEIRELLNIDISPVVELDSTNCSIVWYEIHTHKGIYKNTYTIERTYPFRVKSEASEKIATISTLFFY